MTTPGIRRITTAVGDPAWLVDGHDDVRALLADPRLGRSHPDPERAARTSRSALFGGPLGSADTEEAEHAAMRRMLAPAFSARRMAALRPRVGELVAELLDALLADPAGRADLHEAVAFPLPAMVICELLGVPAADRDAFRVWSDDAAHRVDAERSRQGLARLWRYLRELVGRKQAEPADDVLSLVVAQSRDLDAAADLGAGLLFAGHETTVAAIDRGGVLLLTHREQWDALCADPSGVPDAVEEVLRCALPVGDAARGGRGGLPRYAKVDLSLHGVDVAAGDLVLLSLQGANEDARRVPEPSGFDPTRRPNPHLTFGHGPRFCLGAPLARLELTALFDALVRRVPTLRLAVPVADLRARDELLTGGLDALPVVW